MSTAATLTCPKCKTVLRPAKPLRAGKSVKCPKCGTGFVVGEDSPAPAPVKAAKPSPVQKKPAAPVAPVLPVRDDDEDGDGSAYAVKVEAEQDGPAIDYAPDVGVRDLRGPAMTAIVDPSNKLILVGIVGFLGWAAFLVILLIPILFPLESKEDRAKRQAEADAKLALSGVTVTARAPIKDDDDETILKVGDINLRKIADLRWYLTVACLLPLIFGMIYSGVLSMGAVKIQNLESREWGVASSIMAMVPLNAGGLLCVLTLVLNFGLDLLFDGIFKWILLGFILLCVWGTNLAVGIWMLTILNKPDVIAGFEYIAE